MPGRGKTDAIRSERIVIFTLHLLTQKRPSTGCPERSYGGLQGKLTCQSGLCVWSGNVSKCKKSCEDKQLVQ